MKLKDVFMVALAKNPTTTGCINDETGFYYLDGDLTGEQRYMLRKDKKTFVDFKGNEYKYCSAIGKDATFVFAYNKESLAEKFNLDKNLANAELPFSMFKEIVCDNANVICSIAEKLKTGEGLSL